MFVPYTTSNELYHHGIKGQKWGVRRFQNSDGSLTTAGKKRYLSKDGELSRKGQKQLTEMAKEVGRSENYETRAAAREKLVEYLSSSPMNAKRIGEINSLRQKWRNAEEKVGLDYFDSDQRYNDSSKAYKETYDWFKQNNPTYLKKIVKLNNGRTDDLDMYHDFRKAYEGFEDVAWQRGKEEYYKKNPEIKKNKKLADSAHKEYWDAVKKATNDIVGSNSSAVVSTLYTSNSTRLGQNYVTSVNSIVLDALQYTTKH